MIVGAFIFPTLMYVGFILFVVSDIKRDESVQKNNHRIVTILLSLIFAIAITASIYFVYRKAGEPGELFAIGHCFLFPVLCISVSLLFVYFFLALLPLFQHCLSIFVRSIKQMMHLRLLLALLVVIAIKSIIHWLSNGEAGPLTLQLFIEVISVRALAYPVIFIVSHIIYYGPIVYLLMYFWKDVINYLQREYLGILLVTACYIALAIDSESRQIINFLPLAVIALCQILNTQKMSASFVYFFVALSLILSRVWLPLSHGWVSLSDHPPQVTLEFPMQWYFMSQAPWMAPTMYVVYLAVSVFVFGITIFTFRKKR